MWSPAYRCLITNIAQEKVKGMEQRHNRNLLFGGTNAARDCVVVEMHRLSRPSHKLGIDLMPRDYLIPFGVGGYHAEFVLPFVDVSGVCVPAS